MVVLPGMSLCFFSKICPYWVWNKDTDAHYNDCFKGQKPTRGSVSKRVGGCEVKVQVSPGKELQGRKRASRKESWPSEKVCECPGDYTVPQWDLLLLHVAQNGHSSRLLGLKHLPHFTSSLSPLPSIRFPPHLIVSAHVFKEVAGEKASCGRYTGGQGSTPIPATQIYLQVS